MPNIKAQINPMRLTLTLLVLAALALLQALAATPRALAAEACSNQAVRKQQNATYLPDCRAYEQASPAQKGGNEVIHALTNINEKDPFQAAAEGAAVAYTATGAFPGAAESGAESQYLSSSDSLGSAWQTLPLDPFRSLNPQRLLGNPTQFVYYSPDLTCGILQSELALTPLPEGEGPENMNLYVWSAADDSYTLITVLLPESHGHEVTVDGVSEDCSHVIFQSYEYDEDFPEAEETEEELLYEWDAGTLRIASLLPDGTAPEEGITDNKKNSIRSNGRSDLHELSSDGSRVFFDAFADEGVEELECEEECEEVFMRVDGGKAVEISKSETSTPDEGAKFQVASKNGEQVLFTANYGLTSQSSSGASECEPRGGEGCDLYDYDTATGTLTDISADENAEDETGADVYGVLGISEEDDVAYFSAAGQLVPDEGNSEERDEEEEEANVYAYSDGHLFYIASIGEAEADGTGKEGVDGVDPASQSGAKFTVSRVSGDGEYMLFATSKPIAQTDGTAYENTDAVTGEADYEEYEYSLASRTVTCASCDPSGAQPQLRAGASDFGTEFSQYDEAGDGEMSHSLADDGEVFFQTTNPVLPQAVNDTLNVYEWAPEGVGTCPTGDPGGCVSILDGGIESGPSYFVGASANGESVYLSTYEKLAPEDIDGLRDIYDVRVDGGFLQMAVEECSGEKCQGGLPVQEGTQTPGSTLASGNGNLVTPLEKQVEESAKKTVGKVKITKHAVKGTAITLTVKAPAKGKLTASGAGLKKATKSVKGKATYKLKVKLTKAERKKLALEKKLTLKVKVVFKPASGKSSSASAKVKLKR